MKVQEFLEHYGISRNPFHQEDAREDPIFTEGCMHATRHPAWDKIFGSPSEPSSSVVFGEKGSGKTALNVQMVDAIKLHNQAHADARTFLIQYNDFNPFLDAFSMQHKLGDWQLWDHMDAILSLGVRRLVDLVLRNEAASETPADAIAPGQLRKLTRHERRDLLLLTAIYDRSSAATTDERFRRARRALRFSTWGARKDVVWAVIFTLLLIAGFFWMMRQGDYLRHGPWFLAAIVACWLPYLSRRFLTRKLQARRLRKQVRVLEMNAGQIRNALMSFKTGELADQPIGGTSGTDARYVLLSKFQAILKRLGFTSVVVLVDRVDEPHLIQGSARNMHELMRSIFDLKFLKHPGLGVKLLLPRELYPHVARETVEFQDRARLDKQNLVPTLEWSGESLYDLANERLKSCATNPAAPPQLIACMAEDITDRDLITMFARLRIPRHLFKFLYQLISAHCQSFTSDKPAWAISRETLNTSYALFLRDLERYSQGMVG